VSSATFFKWKAMRVWSFRHWRSDDEETKTCGPKLKHASTVRSCCLIEELALSPPERRPVAQFDLRRLSGLLPPAAQRVRRLERGDRGRDLIGPPPPPGRSLIDRHSRHAPRLRVSVNSLISERVFQILGMNCVMISVQKNVCPKMISNRSGRAF
jgi:hypothetical protein